MAGSDNYRSHELGVVAAGSAQSVAAGAELLRAGGNAADALVAAVFATAAGDPSITSLAGGAVAIFRRANGSVEVGDLFANSPGVGFETEVGSSPHPDLDFRAIEIDFGIGETSQVFHIGRGSAAVPGAIPGLIACLDRWGSLPLSEVVAPAARQLRAGVPLTAYQEHCLTVLRPILVQTSEGRRHFQRGDGELLRAGDLYRNLELADTLERLGDDPTYYEHEVIARMLEEFGTRNGGQLTRSDVATWKPSFRETSTAFYGEVQVHTIPAPAQGGRFVLLTLELCQRVGLRHIPRDSPARQRLLTAVLRALSDVRATCPELVDRTDAIELVQDRLTEILEGRDDFPSEPHTAGNTTHVSVIDRDGNVAGATISHGEGCGYWIGDTGLHMNNLLGEEDLFPAGFHNFIPGARLTTMMAPTVLTRPDGSVTVLGSGGANRIRTVITQIVVALVDDGLDIEDAVARNRVHFEDGVFSAETYGKPGDHTLYDQASQLARESRFFAKPSLFFGGTHVAHRDADGRFSGVGDPRRGGCVEVVRI